MTLLHSAAAGRAPPHLTGYSAKHPQADSALSSSPAHHESSMQDPTSSDRLSSEPSPSWRCTVRQPRQCWSRKASYRLRYSGTHCWRSPCRQEQSALDNCKVNAGCKL